MTDVSKFYHEVIDDVISGIKDEWSEDGLDPQVLEELKKLWTTKLEETHVFDPEPATNTAAQYLNLFQRSQLQIRPSTLPVRQVSSAGRVVSTLPGGTNISDGLSRGVGVATSLANIRPTYVRTTEQQLQQPQHIQPAQPQRLTHPSLMQGNLVGTLPGVIAANTGATQLHAQPRAVLPAGLQSGAAPQIAALPSGLTGHLVQIGQQTYLVPQTLVGLRQPGASQFSIPQVVGPPGTATTMADQSTFPQTQVDGGHDSDDNKFCDTPASHQPTPGASAHNRLGTDRSVHPSDLEDDDDDDDDDDFVAATPGFAPPSVRSHYPSAHHDLTPAGSSHRDVLGGATPLMSNPPTPMTPPSAASRTPFGGTPGWRRPTPATGYSSGARHPETPSRKRRRRSPFNAADTDTEVDDFDDEEGYDVGEDVELMTNATMTPACHSIELEEDDETVDVTSPGAQRKRSPQRRLKRPGAAAQQPDGNRSEQLFSPGSHLNDVPPESKERGDADSDPLHAADDDHVEAEEEEEEEEPLNSEDDVSDEEPEVLFESDNVVVCQYDKIHRSRNRWRFQLKDGIMAINGRDHVFQKAVGEAEW